MESSQPSFVHSKKQVMHKNMTTTRQKVRRVNFYDPDFYLSYIFSKSQLPNYILILWSHFNWPWFSINYLSKFGLLILIPETYSYLQCTTKFFLYLWLNIAIEHLFKDSTSELSHLSTQTNSIIAKPDLSIDVPFINSVRN